MLFDTIARTNRRARCPARRGLASQRGPRLVERDIRKSAVASLLWMRRRGESTPTAARRLGLKADTLRRWAARWRRDRMQVRPRGRPAQRPDRLLRNEILGVMWVMGPHVGLPLLEETFPEVARAELIELQQRYARAFRTKAAWVMHTLRWLRPGTVWAADFTDPPSPIDGVYPDLLSIRDLPSKKNLAALPAPATNGQTVEGALRSLFVTHGPPLVFKSDNGSAFTCQRVATLLEDFGVLHLLSPPRTPRYNGSAEAGIGSLKTRAHYESARNDRPGHWTCDDIEAARLQANLTAHDDGPLSPTPEQAWTFRLPIQKSERTFFRQVYDQYNHEERCTRLEHAQPVIGPAAEASIDRIAIPRALVECGFLQFRRRRISPPIIRRRVAKIS